MKKLLCILALLGGCGIAPPPRGAYVVAEASVTDYEYNGFNYSYYNDCGPVYYYSDGTYDATCTYTPDSLMTAELIHIGNTLTCPGSSYSGTDYVNAGSDLMDYTVYCQ